MRAIRPGQTRTAKDGRIWKRAVGSGLHLTSLSLPRRGLSSRPPAALAETDRALESTRLPDRQAFEMREHVVDVHDVNIFVMHVKQVDLVRENAAVEAALLDQHDVKSMRIRVDRGRAHTSRGALAAHDQGLHAELGEMRDERCAEEHTGTLFGDDDVLRQRLEL